MLQEDSHTFLIPFLSCPPRITFYFYLNPFCIRRLISPLIINIQQIQSRKISNPQEYKQQVRAIIFTKCQLHSYLLFGINCYMSEET